MKRTSAATERKVLGMIALGETYSSVCLRTGVPVPTLKKIKKRNLPLLGRLKIQAAETQIRQLAGAVERTNRLLLERLDRAEAQDEELAELSGLYRAGRVSYAEYRRRKRGLKPLSIRELLVIHKAASEQLAQKSHARADRH